MLKDIIEVATQYASLGCMIQQQFDGLLEQGPVDEYGDSQVTPGAAEYISERLIPALRSLAERVDDDALTDEVNEVEQWITIMQDRED